MLDTSSWRGFTTSLESLILTWAKPEHFPKTPGPYASYPLADGYSAFSIAFGYLAFVLVFSTVMKAYGKKIGGLYGFKFAYNMIQVMLCSYMCIEAGVQAYKAGYTLRPCEPFNYENPPIGFILYVFYISKILDFMDTFFIIAGQSWAQLSFLHVYHHFTIFLFYWLNLNVGFDGDVYLTIVLNGLIHTVMYTYYFVSLHTKEKIFWKPALTMSQMVQFVVMNVQAVDLIYNDCKSFPTNITWAYGYYIITLLILFAQFFIRDNFGKKKDKVLKKE